MEYFTEYWQDIRPIEKRRTRCACIKEYFAIAISKCF